MASGFDVVLLARLIASDVVDRDQAIATVRAVLLARLAEDELTPDEGLRAMLLLAEIERGYDAQANG